MFIIFPSKRSVSLVYFIVKSANKVYMMLVFLSYFGADSVLLAYLEWAYLESELKEAFLRAELICPLRIAAWAEAPWFKGGPTLQVRAEARGATHFTLKNMFGSWIRFLLSYFQCTDLMS